MLTGNLTDTGIPTNANCIVLQANDVTIDLAGFTITGPGVIPGYNIGITDNGLGGAVLHGIEIRNGVIQGFTVGVDIRNSTNVIVEGLRLHDDVSGVLVGQGLVRDNVIEVTAGPVGAGWGIIFEQPGSTASGNTFIADSAAQWAINDPCPSLVIGNIVTGPFITGASNQPGCVNVNNSFP